MRANYLIVWLVALASLTLVAQPKQKTDSANSSQAPDAGARLFQQNCARCHSAPEGFSSRISGTIVRHMRVRASLSQSDEEALLRFFNP
jgi:cytochrome c